MARIWKEALDTDRHLDHFHAGGPRNRVAGTPGLGSWTYFVRVCGFTFEFASTDQIRECIDFCESKTQPTSRRPEFSSDLSHEKGHWQSWWERVPMKLQSRLKREAVLKALRAARIRFDSELRETSER